MNYQELLSSESENPVLLLQAPALGPDLLSLLSSALGQRSPFWPDSSAVSRTKAYEVLLGVWRGMP